MKPAHVALAVLVAAVWGVNFVVIDVGLRDFPPLLFSAVRFSLAAVPAVFFVGRPRVAWRWVIAVGVALGIMKFGLLFIGMDAGMPSGLASLVLQGQAIFTILFAAVLLRERPRKAQMAGMLLATAGIVVAGTDSGVAGPLGAFLLVVAAGACWGVSNVAMRRASPPDMFRFMVWVSVVPPIPLALISIPFEGWHRDVHALRDISWGGAGAALYVAWGATLFGFGVWGFLLRTYDSPTVAPFSLLVPVFGLAAAWVFQGEGMNMTTSCAAALVIVGIALGMLRPGGRLLGSRAGASVAASTPGVAAVSPAEAAEDSVMG